MNNNVDGRKVFIWFLLTYHNASLSEVKKRTQTGPRLGGKTDVEAMEGWCLLVCSI